jgi:hypothetical protein
MGYETNAHQQYTAADDPVQVRWVVSFFRLLSIFTSPEACAPTFLINQCPTLLVLRSSSVLPLQDNYHLLMKVDLYSEVHSTQRSVERMRQRDFNNFLSFHLHLLAATYALCSIARDQQVT